MSTLPVRWMGGGISIALLVCGVAGAPQPRLVAETIRLTEETWLDDGGHPHIDALHVTERFRRNTPVAMTVDITIDDPKTYTSPWTTTVRFESVPNTDLGEHPCAVASAGEGK